MIVGVYGVFAPFGKIPCVKEMDEHFLPISGRKKRSRESGIITVLWLFKRFSMGKKVHTN
jgi:hypothetical protein